MKTKVDLQTPLKKFFGYDAFKDNQEAIINSLLSGENVFVLMPTGGGKSLCYQLPSLVMEGTAVVISPLIALMKNQVDVMRNMSENDGIAHYLNSSLTKVQIDEVKADIIEGRTKLLFVAPESLTKAENVEFLKQVKISFYAVDEAHCISEWGHDFRPEYRKIRPIIEGIGQNVPIIALTATATEKVRADIKNCLGIGKCVEYSSSFNRPNLYYEVRPKRKETKAEAQKNGGSKMTADDDVVRFIKKHPGVSGIVYCLSRKKVEELANVLCVNGIKAKAYHAGMESEQRSETQDDFLMERVDVIVATIAFGMGIDKPDVRFVIHYDMPKSLEAYYQETGRAGRDGGDGYCLAFFNSDDIQKLEKFLDDKKPSEKEIGQQLLKEITAYAESSICRRKLLLHYFGETYRTENCGMCDNCIKPKKQVEAKEQLCKVLQVILAVKENYDEDYVRDIIEGNATELVIERHHDELEEFGIGDDDDSSIWSPVIRQALVDGYLSKDVESYGVLKLTEKGQKFLKKPKSFVVVEDNDFEIDDSEITPQAGIESAADPELYQMLRDLRKKMSKEKNVPPYVIFQDPSLEDMAIMYPQTLEELQNIQGVGAGKAKRYGQEFCDLIKQHCIANNIQRPEDLRIKTVAKKSILKVSIIQAIDHQVSLDDLAEMKGLDFDELLSEMESIVYSGTRLNIDYFLEEEFDMDCVDEIYDYFKNSETDSIPVALGALGDYSEEEIRLVRVKFISEMAN